MLLTRSPEGGLNAIAPTTGEFEGRYVGMHGLPKSIEGFDASNSHFDPYPAQDTQ
ncbi:MAG: hypothetical protein R6U67_09750 [Sodalinema sp.]|uniref:hypothetical protein n=1 Tax=Sodalinema sp. TaxID=3080550 RepID=UPI00396F4C26